MILYTMLLLKKILKNKVMFTRLYHIVFVIPVSGVYTNPAAALSLEFIICL